MTIKGYCILFYNRCLCKNKQDFFSSKAVESTFLKRHFIQWVQYFFFIPPFFPVSKIRHIGPLYFHLFIHLNNSWSLQKSFQAKSFSIKDWVLSSFFFILTGKCTFWRRVFMKCLLFQLETGIHYILSELFYRCHQDE